MNVKFNMTAIYNTWNRTQRETISEKAGTTTDYLYQLCTGRANASALMAINIEKATKGEITKEALLPEIFN